MMKLFRPLLTVLLMLLPACARQVGREVPPLPDTGLPILELSLSGDASGMKSGFVPAVLRVLEPGENGEGDSLGCALKLRGHTTRAWPKKPYTLKLNADAPLLGMPAGSRWVLLANFCDRTLMRNMVAFRVASLTSLDWTPSCVPVELVLDGRHLGTYLLAEQVRVEPGRLDLEPDGGFLLELDFHGSDEVGWTDPHGACVKLRKGIPFGIKYPSNPSQSELKYIRDYVAEAAEVLYSDDFADTDKGYAAYLDVPSFVDYWLVFELMINHELGNPGSVYMHKDAGGKLVAGPCWDFDWGTLSYNFSPQARDGLVNRDAIWYARLFDDPVFAAAVLERFRELLPELRGITAYIDECERALAASAKLNFEMWDPSDDRSQNAGRLVNGDENLGFGEAVHRLREIWDERLEVIENNLIYLQKHHN